MVGVKRPKLLSENIHSVICTANIHVLKHIIHRGGHIWPFHNALRPQIFLTVRDTKSSFFLGLCPKMGVRVGGWGSRVLNKHMEFRLKDVFLLKKKWNAPKSLKSKINIPFFTLWSPKRARWVIGVCYLGQNLKKNSFSHLYQTHLWTQAFLAPQSGALRISAYRDFQSHL